MHEYVDDEEITTEDGDTRTIQRCYCGAEQEVEVF